MSFSLSGLGLARPGPAVPQHRFAAAAAPCCLTDPKRTRALTTLYRRTRVERRHSVLELEPHPGNVPPREPGDGLAAFYPPPAADDADRAAGRRGPTLAARMAVYERQAAPLAAEAARAALRDANVAAAEVGQVVLVSCTGFAAPGVDVALIDRLGLPPGVGRTRVGFMGCHGALNGLRAAHGVSRLPAGDLDAPAPHVLLVCVELCSLHFAYGDDPQAIVSNALFGDAAAAVVGQFAPDDARGSAASNGPPRVVDHASVLLPEGRDAMTWHVRDHGFEMTLSPTVPDHIARRLRPWLEPWLASHGLTPADVPGWAIHPGGPRVVEASQTALGLPPEAGDPARSVLADVGNVSSGTVLFILDRLRRANVPRPWVALAFGPGLAVEAALIR